MKIIRAVLVFWMLFALNHVSGQSNLWDVVMLKSAEVVRGTITDSIPGSSITIFAGDSLSRTIPRSQIALITTEVKRSVYTKKESGQPENKYASKPVYYQGVVAGGFGIGLDNSSTFKANFINGFGFSNMVSMGLGLGFRLPLSSESFVIPLFYDLRIRVMKTRVAPVMGFGIGGCFQVDREFENTGPIFAFDLGVSIQKSGKSFLMLTLGYENFNMMHDIKGPSSYSLNTGIISGNSTQTTNIRAITLSLAVGF